jgi:hypothetical protein
LSYFHICRNSHKVLLVFPDPGDPYKSKCCRDDGDLAKYSKSLRTLGQTNSKLSGTIS